MIQESNYIECAGVRIPKNWTISNLAEALEKRGVRFTNEQDIVAAFSVFLDTRIRLQQQIRELEAELSTKKKEGKE